MKELINISEQAGKQTVSARELHQFLEVKTNFVDWCKRMFAYGFEENQDYLLVSQKRETNNPKNPYTTETDYALTLDTAKEISMLQRSDKGKQARQYFIEAEKRLREQKKPTSISEQLLITAQVLVAHENQLTQLESKLAQIERKFGDFEVHTPVLFYLIRENLAPYLKGNASLENILERIEIMAMREAHQQGIAYTMAQGKDKEGQNFVGLAFPESVLAAVIPKFMEMEGISIKKQLLA